MNDSLAMWRPSFLAHFIWQPSLLLLSHFIQLWAGSTCVLSDNLTVGEKVWLYAIPVITF